MENLLDVAEKIQKIVNGKYWLRRIDQAFYTALTDDIEALPEVDHANVTFERDINTLIIDANNDDGLKLRVKIEYPR